MTDFAVPTRGAPGFGGPGKIGQASGSDLTFVNCLFQRARMGPEIAGTALACTNTWIMDMRGSDDADGIYLHDQSAGQLVTLSGCVLAAGDDDGIDTLGSTIRVENSLLREWNSLFEDAKAISVFNGTTTVRGTLIVDSTVGIAAKWSGGPATIVDIDHCTLARNLTNVWANRKDNAPGPFVDFRITNSVLWGGDPIQSDFGVTNFTIGYCDIAEPWPGNGNLNVDPMFRDPATRDFALLPFSPCIDSGSPSWRLDPDGSRTDLGYMTFVPPAPRFDSIRRAGQATELVLNAYSNRNYRIDTAAQITGPWTVLSTNFQTNAVNVITDGVAGGQRYYRARWQ